MNTRARTLKAATLVVLLAYATTIWWYLDSNAPSPVAVPEPITPAAVEDWSVVA